MMPVILTSINQGNNTQSHRFSGNQNQSKRVKPSPREITDLIVRWLETLQSPTQPWKLFVTVTMRRYDPFTGTAWNLTEIDKAICTFTRRLDQRVFRHEARRSFRTIARIVARHLGDYEDNPHYHIVVACPRFLDESNLEKYLIEIAKRIQWINGKPHIERYFSSGAIGYLLSDNASELVLEATEAAK
ncbi:MAG: hypothetical protein EBY22_12520 [Gammaproteobacteria bacterium]|nr:hypothetical protein [Gammaproteobacteria bacterium]